ncbi:hypothetical protein QWY86_19915 [Pedobacter aquatilis]|uniref:hypothetical protein n=1 Tax=Pedobacter aquatilis TaxID=351343 RepID=UPI0025B545D3|nr:hypothetical protein [Pedobacter aquatilis]MDN3588954.1 hypothetical protein [Pedobacter aquatilis]
MKNIVITIALVTSMVLSANAQKGKIQTGVMANPNSAVVKALPDLTFDLIPVVLAGGDPLERVLGTKATVKMDINFIVKNIGVVNSKPTKVYATYSFLGTQRVGTEMVQTMRHFNSAELPIPAIKSRKDELFKLTFYFENTPEQAFGKDIKVGLTIVTTGAGSQPELSLKNNQSEEVTIYKSVQ